MCYNSSSSIVNYGYVMLLSIILYIYGDNYDKHISLFSAAIIQIQLIEYFMWTDQKCGIVNKLATIIGRILLFLQPLVILLGAYLFNTMNISNNIMLIISGVYIIAWLLMNINYIKNKRYQECSLSKDGHLQWSFMYGKTNIIDEIFVTISNRIIYFVIMLFSWLLFYNTSLGIFFSLLMTALFLIHYIQFPKYFQWSTLWCFHTSIGFTIYAIVRYFDHKYNFFT